MSSPINTSEKELLLRIADGDEEALFLIQQRRKVEENCIIMDLQAKIV